MMFLPIVERELRVAARRRSTYGTRFAAALIGIAVTGFILLASSEMPPATMGQMLFYALSVLAFGYSLLAGVRHTAECVSDEKREGTLGLLFLTDLKGYDVAFGKLAANSVSTCYALLATFPVLGLPLLMGGVPPKAFWQMLALLLSTQLFSLACGLIISSVSKDSRHATVGTMALISLVTGGLPAFGYLFTEYVLAKPGLKPSAVFLLPSPAYAFSQLLETALAPALGPNVSPQFWSSMLATGGLTVVTLAAVSMILPRCWQDRPAGHNGQSWQHHGQRWRFGVGGERQALRTRLLDINPCLWLAGRDRTKGPLVWGFLGATTLFWLWGYVKSPDLMQEVFATLTVAITVHSVLKIWLASEACRQVVDLRRNGALELLLATPIRVTQILRGTLLAMQRQFAAPIAAVLGADVLLLLLALSRLNGSESEAYDLMLLVGAGMAMLVMDCYALGWVGMWFGLTAKNFNRAAGATISRILVLPWAIFVGSVILLFTLRFQFVNSQPQWEHYLVWYWLAVGAVIDLLFLLWARHKLMAEFRVLATQHAVAESSRPSWWPFG